MASSSTPDESDDFLAAMLRKHEGAQKVREIVMKQELAMLDLANGYGAPALSPSEDAANHLSDVAWSLAFVAKINLLASGPDFPLSSADGGGTLHEFSSLKRDDSFRACVRQVSGEILEALSQAGVCMGEIFRETSAISDLMSVFQQLRTDTSGATDLLPVNLERVGEIGTNCAAKADVVVAHISKARETLFELQEAVYFATGEVGAGREQAARNVDVRKADEEFCGQMPTKSSELFERLKEKAEESDQLFAEALEMSGYAAEIAKLTLHGASYAEALETAKQLLLGMSDAKALDKSGDPAKTAKQLLLGMSDAKGAVKKLIIATDPWWRFRLSDEYGSRLLGEHVSKKEHLRNPKSKDLQRLLGNTGKLVEKTLELSTLDVKEVDHKLILTVVQKGVEVFGKLKRKWGGMLQLFRNLTEITRISLGMPMDFRTFTPAYDAARIGFLINKLAGYYCRVSHNHFLPFAVKLGSLVDVQNPEEVADRSEQKKRLKKEAEAMRKRIEQLVAEIKEEEWVEAERRMAEMDRVFGEYMNDPRRQEEMDDMKRKLEKEVGKDRAERMLTGIYMM